MTSIILTVSCAEDGFNVVANDCAQIDGINGVIRGYGYSDLNFLTAHMCDWKHPQTLTFGGGYNLFPDDDFLKYMDTIEWQCPANAVLVLQPEWGDTIVWRPRSYSPD